jgi:hypothetical protein
MKSPQHIQIEAIEIDKRILERSDVQQELYDQTNSKQINPNNYILGVIRNFYDDTNLPLELNYVFQMNSTDIFEYTKFTIRGCLNNGTKFHTKLWQGYNHLAIIEIDSQNSRIFKRLKSYKNRKRWDPVLILCKSEESDKCKKSIKSGLEKHEKFMKENNFERWKLLKKEEQEFKSANKKKAHSISNK